MNTTTEDRADVGAPAAVEAAPAKSSEWVGYFAFAFAAMAMIGSVIAIGIALRAVERAEERVAVAAAAGAAPAAPAGPITLTLNEFTFSPATLEVPAGSTIELVNAGVVEHNAAVKVAGLSSPTIPGGGTGVFDVSSLAPGTYEMICEIVGHEALGMVGTLIVV